MSRGSGAGPCICGTSGAAVTSPSHSGLTLAEAVQTNRRGRGNEHYIRMGLPSKGTSKMDICKDQRE